MLLKIHGRTLLEHLIDRVKLAQVDCIVLCTSANPEDDPLEELASDNGIDCFRGSEDDVLERYEIAAAKFHVDFAIITWGDEVFCDPSYIDSIVRLASAQQPPPDLAVSDSLPEGTYTYGVNIDALHGVVQTKSSANTEVWRKYFEKNPNYKIATLPIKPEHQRKDLRLTCDYPEDFQLISAIFDGLYKGKNDFTLDEIIAFLDSRPDLRKLNLFRQKEYEARISSQSVWE